MKIWHKDFIGVYENAFSSNWCKKIIELFENHNIPPVGRNDLYKLSNSNIRENSINVNDSRKNLKDIDSNEVLLNELANKLNTIWEIYSEFYGYLSFSPHYRQLGYTGFLVQRTQPTEGYHEWHCEWSLNKEDVNRIAVYTLYLNDVKEGGETEFLYQSLRVPPKTGTICIFPSYYTHLHRGNPPLKESKYIITGWIEHPPLFK